MRIQNKKSIIYKIVITVNGKIYKTLGCYRDLKKATHIFNHEIDKSEKVNNVMNYKHNYQEKCIQDAYAHIYILTNHVDKKYSAFNDDTDLFIIDKRRYNIEEKYHISSLNKRVRYSDIYPMYKEIILGLFYLKHNKIYILSMAEVIDVIICKTKNDALNLHNKLCNDMNKNFLFIKNSSHNTYKKIISDYIENNSLTYNFNANNKPLKRVYL